MKINTTVEQAPGRGEDPPNYVEIVRLQLRRARWFEYARRRFDLVSLDKMTDWLTREPGSVVSNGNRRLPVLQAIFDAIELGEFGAGDWPDMAYLPRIIPIDRIGHFPLRLSFGQIAFMHRERHDIITDLWAPRGLCIRWLRAREVPPPPWLIQEGGFHPDERQGANEDRHPSVYSTGAPGRPTSSHLVEMEMERRAKAGEMITTSMAKEATVLAEWLAAEHRRMPPMTAKTIKNRLTAKWRALGGGVIPK